MSVITVDNKHSIDNSLHRFSVILYLFLQAIGGLRGYTAKGKNGSEMGELEFTLEVSPVAP